MGKSERIHWPSVVTFYLLACLISWPFFWWRDMHPESWAEWDVPGIVKTGSYMWGPGLAAIICMFLFRRQHVRTITLFGTSVTRSLLFWFLPMIPLALFVLEGGEAWVLPFAGFFVVMGEELGWRGYLQDAVRPLRPWKRYLLIGTMWELWHFTNRMGTGLHPSTLIRVSIFIAALFLLSWLMGWLTDRTRSLVVPVTIHAWVNILAEYDHGYTWIIFGGSIPFWAFLLWKWKSMPGDTAPDTAIVTMK